MMLARDVPRDNRVAQVWICLRCPTTVAPFFTHTAKFMAEHLDLFHPDPLSQARQSMKGRQ